ncbi:periplasmic chaperone for outer membrane proteins Skp [Flavobacteriaceae bacterium MAR_2010_188]|nr:periplasmic chaperone for outer membrane proteins Skp [Flavobacteriaceae bacterium MAR_2010_188]
MKTKVLFLLAIIGLSAMSVDAQRGVRIGYIDTEYILENVPEYQEATTQLDKKVEQWKLEVEQRLNEIDAKKKQLNNESVLLTKELYEERLEDIQYEEKEILDYQQKRFGPNGDLMIQKKQLIQPVQDQIFTAVQEIADSRKYDFIFDKSADVVMLYSADRFDISELVIRSITRSAKRTQVQNRSERRAAEEEDIVPEINEELEAREAAANERKSEQQQAIDDRKSMQQAKRDSLTNAADARRQKILDDRAKAKAQRDSINGVVPNSVDSVTTDDAGKTREEILEEKKQQKLDDREARKKELEERRLKILADREKAKQEREEQQKKTDSVPNNDNNEN